jgi:hypothetical protein
MALSSLIAGLVRRRSKNQPTAHGNKTKVMPLDPPEAAEQILPAQQIALSKSTHASKLMLGHGCYFIPLNSHEHIEQR